MSDHIINFNRKLACAYNNKGLVHRDLGEFDNALKYINKSLDLRHDDATLPEKERKRLAIERSYCHENLGLLYKDQSNYKLALHHLQEALNIRKKNLPSNHHMVAQVYNNLSIVYNLVGNPSKSFECTEQALTRQIQSLPDNHSHLGTMYNTLGEAYYSQGQYSMALLNFEKALNIYQKPRTRNPLLEAAALSNMGSVMKAQENFDGALQRFLHALTIIECERPHHHHVACCLNNIGFAYRGKALLPQQHSLWFLVYTSVAFEYYLMDQYEHALQHITEESLETPRIYNKMNDCREKNNRNQCSSNNDTYAR
ncbi:unnamed protein product [Rotaria sordida]|uniref:Kinesin light chain n=1 Tax=Rotaria sordida TaxID=392033 RepID=A0A818S6L3_9BILA|nr:unnamed protein product [Rotaria sordida]